MIKLKKLKRYFSLLITLVFSLTLSAPLKAFAGTATGVPNTPSISHNQWGTDVDGNYDLTCSLWAGNNATSYKLHERFGINGDFKVVAEGTLTDGTPEKQQVVIPIRGKTAIGTYYYKVEFINSFGSSVSSVLEVKVGSEGGTKILINSIDDASVALQFTINQGIQEYLLTNSNNQAPQFTVVSNNTTAVKASIVNGNKLKVEGIASGRAGLKIVDTKTGDERYIGVRVRDAKGNLPGMPDYLSLGQVSEDKEGDLAFWHDIHEDDRNKRTDIRYIYINGGPFTGWRTWTSEDGARAKTYIKESLKSGMIPFFVYYNIPDSDESYAVDLKHINDKAYMEGYFKDLKFLLDICKEYGGDETVGMIFEPDFLGYMMQQSGKQPDQISAIVDAAYSSGVLTKGKDPDFGNNVKGLVEAINYTVNKYYPQAYYGWQFNIWSYDSTEIPNQGLLHKTELTGWDSGRQFIQQVANETANYYKAAGITSYGADFISIDKYGLDGAFEPGAKDNPKASKWFWNADIWNNYLLYVKTLHQNTQLPAVLWQIPVGHINQSQEPDPYSGGLFNELTNEVGYYEDSAPTYFFGDTFKTTAGNRSTYFSTNEAKDPKVKVSGDTITWGGHMEEARDAGIVSILYGAGVNASTDSVGSPAPDDNWWITKAQRYYKNPLPLTGGVTPPPVVDLPLAAKVSASSTSSNGDYTITVDIPQNSKADTYSLYENGKLLKTGAVTTAASTVTEQIKNKPTGTYMYKVDLTSTKGTTSSNNLTVNVSNTTLPPLPVPMEGTLLVDKASNDGNYTLTLGIPKNSNATEYRLYENGKMIKNDLVSQAGQDIQEVIKYKTTGTYEYRLDLINKDGITPSKVLKVNVTSTTPPPVSGIDVQFNVTQDWGAGANFELVIVNNTNADLKDWTLKFDFAKKISTFYDADMTSLGSTYTVTPKPWNATIPKGGKITLSGSCAGSVLTLKPTNVLVTSK